jgi:two-component system sensor kinase FixL
MLIPETIAQISPPENFDIIIDGELPIVVCEKIRLMQVFQNLITNAIKYMDKPQGKIRIGCIEEDDFWKFSVVDNGPGIAEQYHGKIFKMFQTLATSD